jgi:hypothetical protein
MANCINLEDIDHNLGCDGGNVSGIAPTVIFGYHKDVEEWPEEPVPAVSGQGITPLTLEEAGALTGDLVMKPGTRAFEFEFTEDAGQFSVAPVGEIDGGHFEMTLDIVKAKISKKILGLMNAAIGRKLFFIVQDENGLYYLMGNRKRGCTFVTGGDGAKTGTTASDRNQVTLQFKFRSGRALVYEGDTEDMLTPVPA